VAGFARELNFRTALGQLGRQAPEPAATGGITTVASAAPVSALAFYTFGMAAMFVLFTVGSAASRAYLELTNNSFDRILVSGASPLSYLLGKGSATALVALLQLAFLLVVTTVLLGSLRGQPPLFWLQAALVSVLLATSVGALAALVTALSFRWRSNAVSNVFTSVVVALLSLLGGSFFALADSSPLIGRLGQWTPNGAALNAFLGVTQGLPAGFWATDLLRLLLLSVLLLGAALLVFPRRKVA
jgi:ABC-2 type transport system permease protein